MDHSLVIVDYEAAWQPHFARLNKAWLEEYFEVTPLDEYELQHPQETILALGGAILCARHEAAIVGVVSLRPAGPGVLKLAKLAVDPGFRGRGAGRLLCEAAIARARQLGAHTLILFTNEQLGPAMSLYRQLGFTTVPLGKADFARANVKMQLRLT
jgi:ribosomal protein S18 acetylase RimI-like enzyme